MSTSLYWRLPTPSPDGEPLGYALKWVLDYGGYLQDGSRLTNWFHMDKSDIPFLRGVAAAGAGQVLLANALLADSDLNRFRQKLAELGEQAERLIDLINQHGAVEVALR